MTSVKTSSSGQATLGRTTAFLMYLLIAFSYVVNGMDRTVFSNFVKAVNKDFGLSLAQGGFLATVFAIGFAITGLFAGYMLDRWRRKSVMIIGILIYSAFTALIPLSHGFWDLGTYRLITGIGEATQQTAIFTMAGVFFAERRNLALGGMNAAYGLGAILGPLIGTQIYLASSNSWHVPLYVFGAIGFAYAALALVLLSPKFSEYAKDADTKTTGPASDTITTRAGARSWVNSNLILVGIANIPLGILTYGYIGLYPTFLKTELGFSLSAAAFAQSMFGAGAFTGLIAGYLADKFGERRLICFAVIGSMVVGLLMFNVLKAPWQQDILSFFFGTFASGFLFVNAYALTQKVVNPLHIGKASGVASSAHYIGAGFSGAFIGAIAEHAGWGLASVVHTVLLPLLALICIAFVRLDKSAIAAK